MTVKFIDLSTLANLPRGADPQPIPVVPISHETYLNILNSLNAGNNLPYIYPPPQPSDGRTIRLMEDVLGGQGRMPFAAPSLFEYTSPNVAPNPSPQPTQPPQPGGPSDTASPSPIDATPAPVVPPEEVPNEGGVYRSPISWDQRILFFFLTQLQNVLDLSLFSPDLNGPLPEKNNSPSSSQQAPRAAAQQNSVERQVAEAGKANQSTEFNPAQQNSKNPLTSAAANEAESPAASRIAEQNQAMQDRQSVQQMTQTMAKQNARLPTSTTSNGVVSRDPSRLVLAELALKLLTIHQVSQNFVAPGTKTSQASSFAISSRQLMDTTMIAQIGKLVTHVERLKGLLLQRQDAVSEKFYRIVVERLKEMAVELQTGAQTAPNAQNLLQKEVLLERLNQEVEWLSTLLAIAKAENADSRPEGLKTTPLFASQTLVNQPTKPELLLTDALTKATIAAAPSNLDLPKSSALGSNLTYFLPADGKAPLPLSPLIPKTVFEMTGMIQMHLSKNVMQPLPIIIPYPVGIALNESPKENSSLGREGKKKQEDAGKAGFGGGKDLSQLMLLVPAGPVILGDPFKEGRSDEQPTHIEQLDPFLIAATPVTNAQYASWLSDALQSKSIQVVHPGKIYDHSGRLLAMTVEGVRTSQLEFSSSGVTLEIRATPGRENHPVVHVTYYGAQAFCQANGLRLPSEAEWERAAGMLPTEYGQPLKKIRYACSAELLTPSWAIFREAGMAKATQNLTMPVGFFDGQKVYSRGTQRIETNLSVSPWGCSDMSGNVREWTSSHYDEDGLFQITKGGSYGDGAFDLRIAAKTPFPPTHSDPYTGFRAAL